MTISNRSLLTLTQSLVLSACLATPLLADAAPRIEIDTSQTGPVIHKDIYGQFAEHLGHGIYGGIWVGEDSSIQNVNGFRTDVVEALKAIKVPLVRWPGGCFADEYHWRDGVGARDQRPVRVNTHWGGVAEDNAFGTHEFFELVEMLGADAYVNGNLGTGTPREMAEWLTYMTADDSSTLAQERRKNGRDKPWKVAYFGVGNETWGCGGNMRPEYYADLYNHWATFLKTPPGARPKLVASGGSGDDTRWTEVLSSQIKHNVDGISFHYYTLPTDDWGDKGDATGFAEAEWISTLSHTLRMDEFLRDNVQVLDRNDPEKKLGFYVDEWGTWYNPEPGSNPGFLVQQNTLRDALVAALNFNIFHRYAERVHMTNIAQMVNVLQAMILTDGDKMALTPTYHVYGMYSVFQDATSLPISLEGAGTYSFGDVSVPALSASAARGKDGKVYLALVNLDPHHGQSVAVDIEGSRFSQAVGQVLTAADMDAHNSFQQPANVKPARYRSTSSNNGMTLDVPAKSVLVVALEE